MQMDKPKRSKKRKPKKHPEKALSMIKIRNAEPGKYADGNGLYLVVDDSGARRWVLRTVVQGKRRELGLGGLTLVSLPEAREEALRWRKIARKGGDPLAERRQERRQVLTFEEVARKVHELHSANFRNEKHKAQWINTLRDYVFPIFGGQPMDMIQSGDVLAALTPIWNEKPETARRIRQRIRTVFAWAKASGHRSGDNPVEGVSQALPKHTGKKEHFSALPYAELPTFMETLRDCKAALSVKLAFEFLILTAARTSEVLRATWNEIDLASKAWTVPAVRMKAREQHQVPLSPRCLEILETAKEIACGSEYVFPGRSPTKPLSNMALEMVVRRMSRVDITVHGFRSSFRDWAEEKTHYPNSVVEAALAHTVKNKVEAAYLRSKLFDQRRPLMDKWAAFAIAAPGAKVVRIREA
jgi:integrase